MNGENDVGRAFGVPARAKREDIPSIIKLYNSSIVPLWKEQGRDFDMEVVEENIVMNLSNPDYFMYVLREKAGKNHQKSGGTDSGALVAGYIAWEIHPDHTSSHTIAHLRMILAHPEIREKGCGSYMMNFFEDKAREGGCTKVLFDVLVGSPANYFYNALGYSHWSNFMEKYL